ncbi:hypothetical protein Q9Q95_15085 [Sphingomonas sp. DG1-23]|uniref:hypothetical protein n=1 Tax=Sphingomonas sp. DG1-23 TaxID=3068316 RepID=UPI00273D9C90|nr:hypothetical protein [Sphingomonas sp. DG1-23]MDP5280251.1 hypothetical protein [Sphingomonas sp. DG1-23]
MDTDVSNRSTDGAIGSPTFDADHQALVVPASHSPMKSSRVAPEPVRQLGLGFDSAFGEEMRHMVSGEAVETTVVAHEDYRPNTLRYHMTETQEEFNSVISRSAKAKGRYGLFKSGGKFASSNDVTTDSYSINICAIVKKYRKAIYIKPETAALSPEAEKILRRNHRDHDRLLHQFGDTYISHLIPASELLIDMKFSTRSRQDKSDLKGSLSASYGKLVSGKASYAEIVQSAQSHKQVEISISGLDASGVPRAYTAEEAQRIIADFLGDDSRASYATAIGYTPIDRLSLRGSPLNFVNNRELLKRHQFVDEVEITFAYLDNAIRDAAYVAANPDEFDQATVQRAAADRDAIMQAHSRVTDAALEAHAAYRDGDMDEKMFDRPRISGMRPALSSYVQRDRAASQPAPPPAARPVPRPQPRGGGCNGSCAGGGKF